MSQNSDDHPFQKAQISLLKADEDSISVLFKYADFIDNFSKNLAIKLPEHTGTNDHAIN